MLCTRVSHLIDANTGSVQCCLDLEGGKIINTPYYLESTTLYNKDIKGLEDCLPIAASQFQYCPYCGTPLHIRTSGNYCYNIHCNNIRLDIFYQQVRFLNIFFPPEQTIMLTSIILENLTKDAEFNVLQFIMRHLQRINPNIDYKLIIKTMPIVTYLRLLRVFDICEDTLEIIQRSYTTLYSFLISIQKGEFISGVSDYMVDMEFKNAIQMSLGHINHKFVLETIELLQSQ